MNGPLARNSLELEVADFGPIARGKIDLRPLTVFVGPSNTGKSWLAILIYALHRFFSGGAEMGMRRVPPAYYMVRARGREGLDLATVEALSALAHDLLSEEGELPTGRSVALSGPIAREIRAVLNSQGDQLGTEIRRSFGIDEARALIRKEKRSRATVILRSSVAGASDSLDHHLAIEPSGTSFETALPAGTTLAIGDDRRLRHSLLEFLGHPDRDPSLRSWRSVDLLAHLTEAAMHRVFRELCSPAFYLPADRTGVMHAHSTVVSAMIESAPMTGLRPSAHAPLLSGVLADFLQQLIELDRPPYRRSGRKRRDLGSLIEDTVLEGSVQIERSPVVGYPHFTYRPNGWEQALPLMNASSMVSELAPVVLYLRHIVGAESVLIVEEPESHLHPAKQVEFTRQLVAVVRSGVRVIVTTHSEWVLEELANTVRRSGLHGSLAGRRDSETSLKPEQVGAWLFSRKERPKGSVIEEIELDSETGLYPAGYDRVSEALYNEGARIFNQIQRAKGE